MNFDDFIKTHPTCSVVKNSQVARTIYDTIIWNDQNRIRMAELSDSEIPGLLAVAEQIIDFCAAAPQCDLDISNETVKQVIGRMISVSLAPLGYGPAKKKRLTQSPKQTIFKNATAFAKNGTATERIEKRIVPITK